MDHAPGPILLIGAGVKELVLGIAGALRDDAAPGIVAILLLAALAGSVAWFGIVVIKRCKAARWLRKQLAMASNEQAFATKFDDIQQIVRTGSKSGPRASIAITWDEFCKTLIPYNSGDGRAMCNTLRPNVFFNLEDLHFGAGFWRILPGLFVTIGLFLTFLGLISALTSMGEDIAVIGEVGPTTMTKLLTLASAKFIMSLTGLLCSIVFTIVLRLGMGAVEHAINRLTRDIEKRLNFMSLEELSLAQLEAMQKPGAAHAAHAAPGAGAVADAGLGLSQSAHDELPAAISTSITEALTPLLAQASAGGGFGQRPAGRDEDVGKGLAKASSRLLEVSERIALLTERIGQSPNRSSGGDSGGGGGAEMETAVARLDHKLDDLRGAVSARPDQSGAMMSQGAERILSAMSATLESIRDNTLSTSTSNDATKNLADASNRLLELGDRFNTLNSRMDLNADRKSGEMETSIVRLNLTVEQLRDAIKAQAESHSGRASNGADNLLSAMNTTLETIRDNTGAAAISSDFGRSISEASARLVEAGERFGALTDRMDRSSGRVGADIETAVSGLSRRLEDLRDAMISPAGSQDAGAERSFAAMTAALEDIRRNTSATGAAGDVGNAIADASNRLISASERLGAASASVDSTTQRLGAEMQAAVAALTQTTTNLHGTAAPVPSMPAPGDRLTATVERMDQAASRSSAEMQAAIAKLAATVETLAARSAPSDAGAGIDLGQAMIAMTAALEELRAHNQAATAIAGHPGDSAARANDSLIAAGDRFAAMIDRMDQISGQTSADMQAAIAKLTATFEALGARPEPVDASASTDVAHAMATITSVLEDLRDNSRAVPDLPAVADTGIAGAGEGLIAAGDRFAAVAERMDQTATRSDAAAQAVIAKLAATIESLAAQPEPADASPGADIAGALRAMASTLEDIRENGRANVAAVGQADSGMANASDSLTMAGDRLAALVDLVGQSSSQTSADMQAAMAQIAATVEALAATSTANTSATGGFDADVQATLSTMATALDDIRHNTDADGVAGQVSAAVADASLRLAEAGDRFGAAADRMDQSSNRIGKDIETAAGTLAQTAAELRSAAHATPAPTLTDNFGSENQQLLTTINATLEGIWEATGADGQAINAAAGELREAARMLGETIAHAATPAVDVGQITATAINNALAPIASEISQAGEALTLGATRVDQNATRMGGDFQMAIGALTKTIDDMQGASAANTDVLITGFNDRAEQLFASMQAALTALQDAKGADAATVATATADLTDAANAIRAALEQSATRAVETPSAPAAVAPPATDGIAAQTITDALTPILEQIAAFKSEGVNQMVGDLSNRFSEDVGAALSEVSGRITEAGERLSTVTDRMDESAGRMGAEMEGTVTRLTQATEELRAELEQAAAHGASAVRGRMDEAGDAAAGAIAEAGAGVASAFAKSGVEIAAMAEQLSEKAGQDLLQPIEVMTTKLSEMTTALSDSAADVRSVSDGVRATAEAAEKAAGAFAGSAEALETAVGPVRQVVEHLDASTKHLASSASDISDSAKTSVAAAATALQAAETALGGQQRAIEATLQQLTDSLDRMKGQNEQFDDIDEKLGKAFQSYTEHVDQAVQNLYSHVGEMQNQLAPALDTMREIVEQAEHFAPQSVKPL